MTDTAKTHSARGDRLDELERAFDEYLRLETPAVGCRLLEPGDELPDPCMTSEKLGASVIACQAVGMARKYGWTVAVDRENISCPLAAVAFGFREPSEEYEEGQTLLGFFCDDEDVAEEWESNHPRLPTGKYDRLVVGPIGEIDYEPMVIGVYGNTAQVMRLVQATTYHTGEAVECSAFGRLDCADLVIDTLERDAPHMVLPCNGDRVFGGAQDHEMAFAFPPEWAGRIAAGLENTHENGVRYPIPEMLTASPHMPSKYSQAMQGLELPGQ